MDRHRAAELPAAPDRLRRDFTAEAPDQRWVSDITSLRTGQGWLHLAIVLDLYARRIVGWAMASDPRPAARARSAAMAITERRPAPGTDFHSDRGGPYLSAASSNSRPHGIIPSTSRPGHCLDNAVAESFFHTLKTELFYHHHFRTRDQARRGLRLHRRLLQPHPSALDNAYRYPTTTKRSTPSALTTCPLFWGNFNSLQRGV